MPAVEQVEMLGQDHAGLHHVQVVDLGRVDRQRVPRTSRSACFWLSPSRQTRSPGRMHGLQQRGGVAGLDELALGQLRPGLQPGGSRLAALLPGRHASMLLRVVSPVGHAPDTPRLRTVPRPSHFARVLVRAAARPLFQRARSQIFTARSGLPLCRRTECLSCSVARYGMPIGLVSKPSSATRRR